MYCFGLYSCMNTQVNKVGWVILRKIARSQFDWYDVQIKFLTSTLPMRHLEFELLNHERIPSLGGDL